MTPKPTPLVRVLPRVSKELAKLPNAERKAFTHALNKLRQAPAHERSHLLKPVLNPHFTQRNVNWTLRASHKYRVLIGREGADFVVHGFVNRGDKRFYRSE